MSRVRRSAPKALPENFIHLRCSTDLTEALDALALEHKITRSECVRIVLELHLFDDKRRTAASEAITEIKGALHKAQAMAMNAYKARFLEVLDEEAAAGYPRSVGVLGNRRAPKPTLEIASSFGPQDDDESETEGEDAHD